MTIYRNRNEKYPILKDLKDGDIFYILSDFTVKDIDKLPPLYMKVSNTIHSNFECGIVDLKSGYCSHKNEKIIVKKVECSLHVKD